MKKLLFAILLLTVTLTLCACGSGKSAVSEPVDLSANPDTASGTGWSWVGGVDRTLTVEKMNLTVTGEYGFLLPEGAVVSVKTDTKNSLTVQGDENAVGIRAQGRLFFRSSGSLEMKVSASQSVIGVEAKNGDLGLDNMSLSLSAEGQGKSQGIVVGGKLTMNNGSLSVAASENCLQVKNDMTVSSSSLALSGGGEAALDVGGELELANATLSVAGGDAGALLGGLESAASTLSLSGGKIGLYCLGDAEINSGKVEMSGGDAAFYLEEGELDLARGVKITVPEGGTFDGHTVLDGTSVAGNATFYKKP